MRGRQIVSLIGAPTCLRPVLGPTGGLNIFGKEISLAPAGSRTADCLSRSPDNVPNEAKCRLECSDY